MSQLNNDVLTLTTSWYILKSKFNSRTYLSWIYNIISCIVNYNLVIYTNKDGYEFLMSHFVKVLNNSRICIIIKELSEFYYYKYKNNWIRNQDNPKNPLRHIVSWEVNMLWAEKINLVSETIENKYYPKTTIHGWCDIGYFREDRSLQFPNQTKLQNLNMDKIYYACINEDKTQLQDLYDIVLNKNINGLPKKEIPSNQLSFAGGFFLIHERNIEWWKVLFDKTLQKYFDYDYLVKDDQIIILDCIVSNSDRFMIMEEIHTEKNNIWFMFSRLLS